MTSCAVLPLQVTTPRGNVKHVLGTPPAVAVLPNGRTTLAVDRRRPNGPLQKALFRKVGEVLATKVLCYVEGAPCFMALQMEKQGTRASSCICKSAVSLSLYPQGNH